MDLGKKVAILRKKNNLTQESLAEKIGGNKTNNIKMGTWRNKSWY